MSRFRSRNRYSVEVLDSCYTLSEEWGREDILPMVLELGGDLVSKIPRLGDSALRQLVRRIQNRWELVALLSRLCPY